jgi:hypothetical protein
MAYEVKHGEVGFDVLEDGRVHSTGYSTRRAALAAIHAEHKAAWELTDARKALRRFCDGLVEDGLAPIELVKMLAQEKYFRERP